MKKIKWSGFKKFLIVILLILLATVGIFAYLHFFGNSRQTTDYNKLYQDNKVIEQINQNIKDPEMASSSNEADGIEIVEADEYLASSSMEDVASSSEVIIEEASSTEEQIIEEIIPKANGELLIKILNGGGVAGMANKVVELIGQKKYEAAQVGNADNFNYETTLIRYKKDDIAYAEEIKSLIDRRAIIEEADGQEENVVIIIGKSFTPAN